MASSLRYQKICLAVIRIAKDRRREIKMKKNNQPKYQKKSDDEDEDSKSKKKKTQKKLTLWMFTK